MGWFGRKKKDNPYGYVDNAALKGVGGYEPADAADATPPGTTARPALGGTEPGSAPGSAPGRAPSTSSAPFTPAPPQRGVPQAPARPGTRRVAPAGCGVGVVVALVIGVVTALTSGIGDDDDADSAGPASSGESAASETSETSPTPETSVAVTPAIDGWEPVVGGDGEFAYDVPQWWTPEPDTIHGWEGGDGQAQLRLSTSAFTGKDFCPSDDARNHGGAGVTVVDDGDAERAGRKLAERLANAAYSTEGGPKPRVDARPTKWVALSFEGAKSAALAELAVEPGAGDCLPERANVLALAVNAGGPQTVVLVAYADQGYDDATTRQELARLVGSFRTVPESGRHTITVTPTPR